MIQFALANATSMRLSWDQSKKKDDPPHTPFTDGTWHIHIDVRVDTAKAEACNELAIYLYGLFSMQHALTTLQDMIMGFTHVVCTNV